MNNFLKQFKYNYRMSQTLDSPLNIIIPNEKRFTLYSGVHRRIRKDERRFARNYDVIDQLVESANGVLYNGIHLRSGREVIIKQIPRKVIRKYYKFDGRMCPSEIYFHFQASEVTNLVVKPIAWFEK